MDSETKMMLNAILEEMGRMEDRINKKMDERFESVDRRFDKIDAQLESMQHEVNACKLEPGHNRLTGLDCFSKLPSCCHGKHRHLLDAYL